MPSNSMTGDFIQNMLALLQLRQQREQYIGQHELAQQGQRASLLQLLSGITQNMPDRGAAMDFLEAQGQANGLNLDSLLALARGQAPSETSIRAGASVAGREAMTPQQLAGQNTEASSVVTTGMSQSQSALSQFLTGQLGRMTAGGVNQPVANMLGEAGVLRALTNMTPGQFSLDQATHNLNPEEVNAAARMAQGLALTAPQQAANALTARGQDMGYSSSMAGNRLGWAQLAQQGELGYLNLAMQQQLATMQAGTKGTLQINDIPELVKTQQTLTDALAKSSTPAQRQMYLNSMGTVNSLLNSLGVPTPQISPTGDVNQFTPFNPLHPWQTWQSGGRGTLPMYVPGQQQQQQQGAQQFLSPSPGMFGTQISPFGAR